jgi:hypothetical protein
MVAAPRFQAVRGPSFFRLSISGRDRKLSIRRGKTAGDRRARRGFSVRRRRRFALDFFKRAVHVEGRRRQIERTAMLPQPMSNPTPTTETRFS